MFTILLIYYLCINTGLFWLMGSDKRKAGRESWRIKEKTLWYFAFLGGALGGWVGMKVFRHKTKHKNFVFGYPILLILHVTGLVYLWLTFYG